MESNRTESDDITGTAVDLQKLSQLSFMDFWVHDFSPSDISLKEFTRSIPPLVWQEKTTTPSEMTIKNTGHMLNVEAEYSRRRPSLSGALLRCPYEFWCFHFHWGTQIDDGSEHRLMGKRFPVEIHVVFYNVSFSNTNEALNAKDGVLILVYMCNLTDNENLMLKSIMSNLEKLKNPGKSTSVDPFALSGLFDSDLRNYLMYWGAHGDNQDNPILWIISPKLVPINAAQLSSMRSLKGIDNKCIVSNCRSSKSAEQFKLFIVNQPTCTVKRMWRIVNNDFGLDLQPNGFGDLVTTQMTGINPQTRANRNVTGRETLDVTTALVVSENKCKINEQVGYIPSAWEEMSNKEISRIEIDKTETDYEDLTKNRVMRSIDTLLNDLRDDTKTAYEGVRMNSTALRREMHIKDKLQSKNDNNHDNKNTCLSENKRKLDEQVGYISSVWEEMSNKEISQIEIIKTETDNEDLTKDSLMRSIDTLLNDLRDDTKTEYELKVDSLSGDKSKTIREGVRMNSTALRREMHIKDKLQGKNDKKDDNKNICKF